MQLAGRLMKLGFLLDYRQRRLAIDINLIRSAEALGYDSVWLSEAWGNDVVSAGSWILAQTTRIRFGTAIMQIPARAPAMAAMTAISLDHLAPGRFILGLGASGPQVVEGWYGVPYQDPLGRTREYIEVVRKVIDRTGKLEVDGRHYQIPYHGIGSSGLGKPLKSILHGDPQLPIYAASFTPAGIRLAAEVADGIIPIWMDPARFDLFEEDLAAGFARPDARRSLADFAICPFVFSVMGDDLNECRRPLKEVLALYVGGMGSRERNFYKDYVVRLGYAEEANRIQHEYLSGRVEKAAELVPDELVDSLCLVGPQARIRERLQDWKRAASRRHVDTMIIQATDARTLEVIANECL
jgi:F420-dependent oxidoreductase-like protein